MSVYDWIVLLLTLGFIGIYGIIKSRKQEQLSDYILGAKESSWWKVGFGVMATQASAITFISTTGQGYSDGLRFVQFYFGLPLAMLVICVTIIPVFYKAGVFTAYEYLENRFDAKTRTFAAVLFLIQRGLAAGITIYAPSIILSSVFHWNLNWTIIICGVFVILYTITGGAKAVTVTQVQQMTVIILGMAFIFCYMIYQLPKTISFIDALYIAGQQNKMKAVDFSFEFKDRYNFWAGITGGFFLALSYFGTDQSQVQRYLSGKNISESRKGLIMNGILKIPMQFFILLTGVLLYVLLLFQTTPLLFNSELNAKLQKQNQTQYESWINQKSSLENERLTLLQSNYNENRENIVSVNKKLERLQSDLNTYVKKELPNEKSQDRDYIFLHYILSYLPRGLIGLLIAVILCAAMSSISAELNALSGTTTVDIYKRWFTGSKPENDIWWSRFFCLIWGILAILFALYANVFENLIQFINIIGSLFYGTVLGIFVVAFYIKKTDANPVFYAAIIAQCITFLLYFYSDLGYLWYNFIACLNVVWISSLLNLSIKNNQKV